MFGGLKSEQKHQVYNIHLCKENYACTFEVLDQNLICNNISAIFNGFCMSKLEELGIAMSDTQGSTPIEVLLRADVAEKLYTGQKLYLDRH